MADRLTSEEGGLRGSAGVLPAVPAHRQYDARRDADDERHRRRDTHERRLSEDGTSSLRRLSRVLWFGVVLCHPWTLQGCGALAVRSQQRDDDETVADGDDRERNDAHEHERQPRPHLLLEVGVGLRTTTDPTDTSVGVPLDVSCPEDMKVLADGGDDDHDADADDASRWTDFVLDERQTDRHETVDGERHEDPDCRVAGRVEREILRLARPSVHTPRIHALAGLSVPRMFSSQALRQV